MHLTPSHEASALRTARLAVLNDKPIPATIQAVLEARGIDVGELQARLIQSKEYVQ